MTVVLLVWSGPIFDFRSGPGKPNQRKASSWTFRGGIPEQKLDVNHACFPKEKHQNSQKWAKFMNFLFWPFLYFACSPEEFCEYFFCFCLGILHWKNGGDFWWIFSGLRLPRNEARKVLEKFGENWEQNSGRKLEKFGKLSFCNFSGLTFLCGLVCRGDSWFLRVPNCAPFQGVALSCDCLITQRTLPH